MSIKSTKGVGDGLEQGEEKRNCGNIIQLAFNGLWHEFQVITIKTNSASDKQKGPKKEKKSKRNRKGSKTCLLHLIILPNFCF